MKFVRARNFPATEGRLFDGNYRRVCGVYERKAALTGNKLEIYQLKIVDAVEEEKIIFEIDFLTVDMDQNLVTLYRNFPPEIFDNGCSIERTGFNQEKVIITIPDDMENYVQDVVFALDRLDPFDNALKQDLESTLRVRFGFSREEIDRLIEERGVDYTLAQVKDRASYDIPGVAYAYQKKIFGSMEITEDIEVSEQEILSLINCYAAVDEDDRAFASSNRFIFDFIMKLDIESFSEETQIRLREERFKAAIKSGYLGESDNFLASLCGYAFSEQPFPSIDVINQNSLAEKIIAMARIIKEQNAEIQRLHTALDATGDHSSLLVRQDSNMALSSVSFFKDNDSDKDEEQSAAKLSAK